MKHKKIKAIGESHGIKIESKHHSNIERVCLKKKKILTWRRQNLVNEENIL